LKRFNIQPLLVVLVLLLALSMRIWGVGYDLPYVYHPDEPAYVNISQRIFKTGDLNPHFFKYPSLFFYINAAAYTPYYFYKKSVGIYTSRSDIAPLKTLAIGVTKAPIPAAVLLGRIITVLFGVGAVVFTYLIGRQLTGKMTVGLFASLLMAVSPATVGHSRLITPDTFVVFFAAASFLFTVLVYQQAKTWQYILAGICIGLTASSKYNGALIVFPLLLAHFFHHGRSALKKRNLYLALLMCIMGFLATTPYSLMDFHKFIADLKFEAKHYATGHAGMEGGVLKWYLRYMWLSAGIVYIFAALEIFRGIIVRNKELILLSIFPIVYFVFINSFVVRNERTFLPLTPFLFLLAASFLTTLIHMASKPGVKPLKKWVVSGIVILAAAGLCQPAAKTVWQTLRLTMPNSRETARVWINNNLEAGAKIAIEPYSP